MDPSFNNFGTDYYFLGNNQQPRQQQVRNGASGQNRQGNKDNTTEPKPNVVIPQPMYDILTSDLAPPPNDDLYGAGDQNFAFLQQFGHNARKDYPFFQVIPNYHFCSRYSNREDTLKDMMKDRGN